MKYVSHARAKRGYPISVCLLFVATLWLACSTPVSAAPPGVTILEVSFQVVNRNHSGVPCLTDGRRYRVRGEILYPTGSRPSAATLYLHGLGFGKFLWRYDGQPGLDFAAGMAALGHASVVVDRLGYDSSGHPYGFKLCVGSEADVANQIVQALREGRYQVTDGGTPLLFQRIALAGHSLSGAVAEVSAYSFHNIDALLILSFADLGASARATLNLVESGAVCALGGRSPEPGTPRGYAAFGQNATEFRALMFHSAAPEVVADITALRNLDPCGDFISILPSNLVTTLHLLGLGRIQVPTLLLCGAEDVIFPPLACGLQQALYSGTSDFTYSSLPDAGHAITVEAPAPELRRRISDWLDARGF